MRCLFVGLVALMLVPVVVFPVGAEQSPPGDLEAREGMEYIRLVFNQPEVRSALKNRGYNPREIDQRLLELDRSLTDDQERALAQRLRDRRSGTPENSPSANAPEGNAFLGTTLDLLTEILLLPIKILSWIIPGL